MAINLRLPLDPLRCQFICPGEKQGQREPQDNHGRKYLHDPGGRLEGIEQQVADLRQKPADERISDCHAENVAAL